MKIAIISPSGSFYGSEQTLFGFLKLTKNSYDVYIHVYNGHFLKVSQILKKHRIMSFKNPIFLYFKLTFKLFIGLYDAIYCNEGGHIKYIKIMARLIFWKKFTIHIRMAVDANSNRIGYVPSNLQLISVSNYISNLLWENCRVPSMILSSPYRGLQNSISWSTNINLKSKIKIGIIGRFTPTKGIKEITDLILYCEKENISKIELHFFGEVEKQHSEVIEFINKSNELKFVNIFFHGFAEKEIIYNSIDVVAHFNCQEAHGVIFLEALNFGRPFIGFNCGGIGNIAERLNLTHLMVKYESDWEKSLIQRLDMLDENLEFYKKAQLKMLDEYSEKKYCEILESKIIYNE